jgi:ribosomal protein S17E
MGRIKSTLVKRTGEQLVANMPESFSEDYEKNKKALGSSTMPSKRIRNMVAGYLSRLKKNSQSKQA